MGSDQGDRDSHQRRLTEYGHGTIRRLCHGSYAQLVSVARHEDVRMTSRIFRSGVLLATAALVMSACGGDSDGGPLEPVALQQYTGTVNQILSDDLTIDYTIDLPENFEIGEFSSDSQQSWEDPSVEFGVKEVSARISWTTVQYDEATLLADISTINEDRQPLGNGSEDPGFAFVTYATPSTSSDAIFSASAQTSRSLGDNSVLLCTATWSTGIDDEWSDEDVAVAAELALDVCRSYNAA